MRVSVKDNIDEATTWLMKNSKKMPSITKKALNKTAFKINDAEKAQAVKYLNKPTKFTLNGFRFKGATDRNLEVKMFIAPIQASYLWYQVEGGIQPKMAVPVMTNIKAEGRLTPFGNVKGKKSGLLKNKGDFFGKGKGGRTNIYRTKGRVGHKTTTTQFTIKDQSYRAIFPYYKIGEGVVNNMFDKIFTKAWNKEMALK
jgi:hypothetical protein